MAPTVVSISSGIFTIPESSYLIPMPNGSTPGDRLEVFVANFSTTYYLLEFEHIVTEDDTEFIEYVPSSATTIAYVVYKVIGGRGRLVSVLETGNSTNPDPPILFSSAEDSLWISAIGWDGVGIHSAYSSNYNSNQRTHRFNDPSDGIAIAVSTRTLNTTSENPGPHTLDTTSNWGAHTIVILPEADSGGGGTLSGISNIIGSGISPNSGSGLITGVANIIGSGITSRSGGGSITGISNFQGYGIGSTVGGGTLIGTSNFQGYGLAAYYGGGTLSGTSNIQGAGNSPGNGAGGNILGASNIQGAGRALYHGGGFLNGYSYIIGGGDSPLLPENKGGGGTVTGTSNFQGAGAIPAYGGGFVTGLSNFQGKGYTATSGGGSITNSTLISGTGTRGVVRIVNNHVLFTGPNRISFFEEDCCKCNCKFYAPDLINYPCKVCWCCDGDCDDIIQIVDTCGNILSTEKEGCLIFKGVTTNTGIVLKKNGVVLDWWIASTPCYCERQQPAQPCNYSDNGIVRNIPPLTITLSGATARDYIPGCGGTPCFTNKHPAPIHLFNRSVTVPCGKSYIFSKTIVTCTVGDFSSIIVHTLKIQNKGWTFAFSPCRRTKVLTVEAISLFFGQVRTDQVFTLFPDSDTIVDGTNQINYPCITEVEHSKYLQYESTVSCVAVPCYISGSCPAQECSPCTQQNYTPVPYPPPGTPVVQSCPLRFCSPIDFSNYGASW